jgi:DNA polymerase III subunit delta'
MTAGDLPSLFEGVIGQQQAVDHLVASVDHPVHAYLFVGPAGSGKRHAARVFAAALIGRSTADDERGRRLAFAGDHPDIREIVRVGASITKPQAMEIVQMASLAPIEGRRKVLILDEFHLVAPEAAAVLLKTIEEPPPSTVFVVLADLITPDLVTIASRCARIDFRPLTDEVIETALIAEGIPAPAARDAARSAAGDLDRARLLAVDRGLSERRDAFAGGPAALDGTGAKVVSIVADLLDRIELAAEPLRQRHAAELVALDERVKALGERGSGRKQVEDRHKREARRHRADELRSGLAVTAGTYRDSLVGGARHGPALTQAVIDIHRAIEAIDRNPNESLLLQSLLLRLPGI